MTANTEVERHLKLSRWVAREILPHEPRIRAWFQRNRVSPEDVDEIVQEAYCSIARLESFEAIDAPAAYFFSIARNHMLGRLRRAQIVSIELFGEQDPRQVFADNSFEEGSNLRHASARVLELIGRLPEKCRRIVELRKVEGWSQKEIASHLGMSEKAVEKQIWLGIRAVKEAWDRRSGHKRAAGETQTRLERILP